PHRDGRDVGRPGSPRLYPLFEEFSRGAWGSSACRGRGEAGCGSIRAIRFVSFGNDACRAVGPARHAKGFSGWELRNTMKCKWSARAVCAAVLAMAWAGAPAFAQGADTPTVEIETYVAADGVHPGDSLRAVVRVNLSE